MYQRCVTDHATLSFPEPPLRHEPDNPAVTREEGSCVHVFLMQEPQQSARLLAWNRKSSERRRTQVSKFRLQLRANRLQRQIESLRRCRRSIDREEASLGRQVRVTRLRRAD